MSKKEILGIDIGGTGIKGAPVNLETGEITQERFRILTPKPATPENVAHVVVEIVRHFDWKGPMGVGFPAVIKSGVVMSAANVDPSWIGCNGQNLLERFTGCPTTLINDADAAGLAEMYFGAGKYRQDLVIVITLGTGIGTAMFYHGKLFPNAELGHLRIRGKEAEHRAAESIRIQRHWSWKKWGEKVSEYLQELDRLFFPDLFIVGGGASNKWAKLEPHLKSNVEVVPAHMANVAGIVGAALSALPLVSASTPSEGKDRRKASAHRTPPAGDRKKKTEEV